MGQQGRVVMPNGLGGVMPQPTTEQLLGAILEQAEWPNVSEWLVLQECRLSVLKTTEGARILQVWTAGQRRGYRIPLDPINAAVISRELGSGLAVAPESDEVADAASPPAPEEPPTPPTMGQG